MGAQQSFEGDNSDGGGGILDDLGPLLRETQVFAKWSLADIRQLHKRFKDQIFGYSLVEPQFECVISFKEDLEKEVGVSLQTLFGILDNDNDGRIDGLELLGGLALCCIGSFEEKTRFCFELYDFNLNASLSKNELIMMMQSSVCGMLVLTGMGEEKEPPLEYFEGLADQAVTKADKDLSGAIGYEEFVEWARSNREMMTCLERLSKVSRQVHQELDSEDSAVEASDGGGDSDLEQEVQTKGSDLRIDAKLLGMSHLHTDGESKPAVGSGRIGGGGDEFMAVKPWVGAIVEPSDYMPHAQHSEAPDTNLQLNWVHGYRAQECRNNLRYLTPCEQNPSGGMVYPAAALGVVYDHAAHRQRYYQGHTDDVTSLAVHPGGVFVATGQVGKDPSIHVWNSGTLECQMSICGFHKRGVTLLAFSPDGSRLASVGLDNDHSIALHEWRSARLLASGKGHSNKLLGLTFSPDGKTLVAVGVKVIRFFDPEGRSLKGRNAIIGKMGQIQTFLCVCFIGKDPIVGCASGELYRFSGHQLVQVVQAHGAKEAVMAIAPSPATGGIVTGGADNLVHTWDSSLKGVGPSIDFAEDLDGDRKADNGSANPAVISVCAGEGKLLVGTRGSDIFEILMPKSSVDMPQVKRLLTAHYSGELWGLATHPTKAEYATAGDDKSLRIWSIRLRDQLAMRPLPVGSRAVMYSPDGSCLALGMENGAVAVVRSGDLSLVAAWRHSKKGITDIKYSPDGKVLAVGGHDRNIYLYNVEANSSEGGGNGLGLQGAGTGAGAGPNGNGANKAGAADDLEGDKRPGSEVAKGFTRRAVCSGHSSYITHIDFSSDGKVLQSNCGAYELLFWDTFGNQIRSATSLRDIHWASWTCTLGWPVQGIWPPFSDGTDINAVDRDLVAGVLVTGDDMSSVNLFRYPCVQKNALHLSYKGHSSHVTNVRFTSDHRYVISTGGDDRCIFQWTHEMEDYESSDDEGGDRGVGGMYGVREANAESGIIKMTMGGTVVGAAGEHDELMAEPATPTISAPADSQAKRGGGGDEFMAVKPWIGAVVEPSYVNMGEGKGNKGKAGHGTLEGGTTDVDLELCWVHGYRAQDCRNNLFYTAGQDIVFHAAALGIVYKKGLGKQVFEHGSHTDDIISMAMHPSGRLVATGEVGKTPKIVVWDVDTCESALTLQGFHRRGIPLLAFTEGGELLISVGLDDNHSMAIYNWKQKRLVACGPTDKGKTLGLCALPPPESGTGCTIVTCAQESFKFWTMSGQNLKCQKAVWGPDVKRQPMLVVVELHGHAWSGGLDGTIVGWHGHRAQVEKRLFHKASVNAMSCSSGAEFLVTGDKAGIVLIWSVEGGGDSRRTASAGGGGRKGETMNMIMTMTMQRKSNKAGKGADKAEAVAAFDMDITPVNVVDCHSFLPAPLFPAVRAVHLRNGLLLVGTQGSDIYEVTQNKMAKYNPLGMHATTATDTNAPTNGKDVVASQRLLGGHCKGEVWGLAAHPSRPEFATAADDCTVRRWSLTGPVAKTQLGCRTLPTKARCVAYSADGHHLAVAMTNGKVLILLSSLQGQADGMEDAAGIVKELADAKQWIQAMKYSFEGSSLAVGSHDRNIYIYNVRDNYKLHGVCGGHTSYVTHLDFGILLNEGETLTSDGKVGKRKCGDNVADGSSTDGKSALNSSQTLQLNGTRNVNHYDHHVLEEREVMIEEIWLQSNSGAYELLFHNVSTCKQMPSATRLRDVTWATWTCTLGWPVQGIWPASADGTDINAVDRSHTYKQVPVIATADDLGKVKLFNYPSALAGAVDKTYCGHSSHVTNLCFSHDDSHLISTGGNDRCVFVWKTDCIEEAREREAGGGGGTVDGSVQSPHCSDAEDWQEGGNKEEDDAGAAIEEKTADAFLTESGRGGGDEFMAVKPWLGAIREPSRWKESPGQGDPPAQELALHFVHGYQAQETRGNLAYADSTDEIIFHSAAVGVVHDIKAHKQLFNTEHVDDIVSLAVHPQGHTVATGALGKKAKIVLWDSKSGATLLTLQGFHKRGVSNLAFSGSGALLASVGMDDDHSTAIYNVEDGAFIASGKCDRAKVLGLAMKGETEMVSCGVDHVKFWVISGTKGEMQSKKGLFGTVPAKGGGTTAVCAAYLAADVVTGQVDGTLYLWKGRNCSTVRKAHEGTVSSMYTFRHGTEGLITGGMDGRVLMWAVGLTQTHVFDLSAAPPDISPTFPGVRSVCCMSGKALVGTQGSEIYEIDIATGQACKLLEGHCKGELWGLCTHPTVQQVATVGDDGFIRVWDALSRVVVHRTSVEGKARALAYSPDGQALAVGLYSGYVAVLLEDLSSVIASVQVAKEWIEAMTYSPDGRTLAVGSHDNCIYLLDTASYFRRAVCRGHSSYITHLDWTTDSKFLQSNCGAYELLFWDAGTGKQVTSASSLRDANWATWTCMLGWPVQGIWPECSDGTDINSVCRAKTGGMMATGDDMSMVKLFRYPCPHAKAKFKAYKGHSSHVSRVMFSVGNRFLFSTGGNDRALLQWAVKG